MDSLARDVRDSLRQWRRTPLVTGVTLLSLTLGIGANLALFSLVSAVRLSPLPVREAERLTRLVVVRGDYMFQTGVWAFLRREQTIFEGVAAAAPSQLNLAISFAAHSGRTCS
jgi:hypothetical protein